jgi:hypothetical protein
VHRFDCSKVQPAKRRSYARCIRTCRFRFPTTVFSMAFAHEAQRPLELHENVAGTRCGERGTREETCFITAPPGCLILRLRSAVRGCRRHVIGPFGVIPILAMHMRISRRFAIPELADRTQEIELRHPSCLDETPHVCPRCESGECIESKAAGPVVLHLHVSTMVICIVFVCQTRQTG